MTTLLELVAAEASGELVSVSTSGEVHVYLQGGRIAWATDSALPFAFSRHLLAHTSITPDVFQHVLETCRRDRLPLGETLIEWQVVTLEQIRAALIYQISEALKSLRASREDRTLFLERRREYASYDTRLTFDASALLPRSNGPRAVVAASPTARAEALRTLALLRPSLPEGSWLALADGVSVIEIDPPRDESFIPRGALEHTLLDGADIVAFRTARDTILGVALPDAPRTLWCRIDADAPFGPALAALCGAANVPPKAAATAGGPPRRDDAASPRSLWPAGQAGDGTARDDVLEMRALMARAPEIDGILVMEEGALVSGIVRNDVDAGTMQAIVRKRAGALRALAVGASRSEESVLDDLGYRYSSIGTGEAETWCFGTETPGRAGRTAWVFTTRDTAQGLGWAYLTSLTRQLATLDRTEHAATG